MKFMTALAAESHCTIMASEGVKGCVCKAWANPVPADIKETAGGSDIGFSLYALFTLLGQSQSHTSATIYSRNRHIVSS